MKKIASLFIVMISFIGMKSQISVHYDHNPYFFIEFPNDKEVIPTKSPLFTWSHSEPFSGLAQGESFRMVIAEIKSSQSREEALLVNSPVMVKDYLTSHSLHYPVDAKPLEEEKRYAWQVQKLVNGVVLNKTETREFRVFSPEPVVYTALDERKLEKK
ncbi:MAG: hypothetical protein V4608_17455 [Bacteroidota bacterium]